jgi:hypothetical protein
MKFLNDCVNRRGPISVLCSRICCESAQAAFDPTLWLLAVAIRGASRIVGRRGPVQRAIAHSGYVAAASRPAVVGRSDCLLP